jgi:hypothetical protein
MSETYLEERNTSSRTTTSIVSYAPLSVKKPHSIYSSLVPLVQGVGNIWVSTGDLISNFMP